MKEILYYGLETEYALCGITEDDNQNRNKALFGIIDELLKSKKFIGGNKKVFSIFNGGKVCLDMSRVLETATPECKTIKDVIKWHFALQDELKTALLKYQKKTGKNFRLLKKMTNDKDIQGELISHETYSLPADCFSNPKQKYLVLKSILPYIMPFLTVRHLIGGEGTLNKETPRFFIKKAADGIYRLGKVFNLRTIDFKKRWLEKLDKYFTEKPIFKISQSADYIVNSHGQSSLPFGNGASFLKIKEDNPDNNSILLHVHCGDSGLGQYPLYTSMGTLALIIETFLNNGFGELPPQPLNPVLNLLKVSFDPELKKKIRLQDGSLISAIEMHKWYLKRVSRYLASTDQLSGEKGEILEIWNFIVSMLEQKRYEELTGLVGWPTLKLFLSDLPNQEENYLVNAENSYFDLMDKKSFFRSLDRRGKIKKLIDKKEIQKAKITSPDNSPAQLRAFILQLLRDMPKNKFKIEYVEIDWNAIKALISVRGLNLSSPLINCHDNNFLRVSLNPDFSKLYLEIYFYNRPSINDLLRFTELTQLLKK